MKKTIIVIIGMVMASALGASPIRTVMAARTTATSEETSGWKNPYITDGLIAMWDGEWNVAPGKHDDSSSIWVDLTGITGDLTKSATATWLSKGLYLRGSSSHRYGATLGKVGPAYGTIEIVLSRDSGRIAFCSGLSTRWVIFNYDASIQFDGSKKALCISGTIAGLKSITIVYNGDVVSAIYVNGSPATTTQIANSWGVGDGKMIIGNRSVSPTSYVWAGTVAAIRLYDRRLEAEEIAANYLIDKERFGL